MFVRLEGRATQMWCKRDGKLNESQSVTELSFSHSYQSKLSKTGSNRVNYVCTCPVQSLHMLS